MFRLVSSLALRLIHVLYSLALALLYLRRRVGGRPRPLASRRNKIPAVLGLLLVYDEERTCTQDLVDSLVQCAEGAAAWCRAVGVKQLIVYDRQGILRTPSVRARLQLPGPVHGDTLLSDNLYPITPPLSDDPDSQTPPLSDSSDTETVVASALSGAENSTVKSRRQSSSRHWSQRSWASRKGSVNQESTLSFHFISRDSGKPAIAAAATTLRRNETFLKLADQEYGDLFQLTVSDLQDLVEGDHGFPPPDLMVVHHLTPRKQPPTPLELHGFPPWQIRLSEIYHNDLVGFQWPFLSYTKGRARKPYSVFTEQDFCAALDQYAGAEMRLGK
ncbi:hypothetical protein EVG20_g138 [Dentipellis fragilis]|uniref:ditrans,polycis-polyprenyl diphosphate synthase [(2E,6E)-farnesyldiphosphate specific] n=1 Tax=Dentipellis fragilis TaxID=205917 RepID=A0A4Y9ZDJ5_9AGAM|nr:hypothetical protein EVG20_g138 [Dentipellis fragilis]